MFTFLLLASIGSAPTFRRPGVDPQAISAFFKASAGSIFGFLDIFSGGALRRLSVFALGIMPYISSSIILQLLTVVWPYLEKLSKEGEMGRKKITQYTRYGTVLLSFIQATGIALWLEKTTAPGGAPARAASGLGIPAHDGPDAHDRNDLHHVARRADHRARHRQRHLADHLRGHRGRPAARDLRALRPDPEPDDLGHHARRGSRLHVRDHRARRLRRARRSAGSRSSTPSASSAGASTAARTRTCRCA